MRNEIINEQMIQESIDFRKSMITDHNKSSQIEEQEELVFSKSNNNSDENLRTSKLSQFKLNASEKVRGQSEIIIEETDSVVN